MHRGEATRLLKFATRVTVAETTPLPSGEERREIEEKRVGPLELFFDLVFVFALTQVTQLMSDKPTWAGLGEGMLVLAMLWWAWAAYAWLTNYINAEEGVERLLMFGVMAAFLVAALAAPQAFGAESLTFALAYAAARWLHIFIFAEANDDVDAAMAIRRLARTAIPGPALLIAAAFLDPPFQAAVWVLALAIDFSGPYVFGVRGFRVSAGHFAERFSLIVIIALGESIVAIGAGLAGELDTGVLIAALLAIVIACSQWWGYFDVVAVVSERSFRQSRGHELLRRARDSYSYLHLPMIAGIILIALGIKKTVADVDEPLKVVPAVALFGGIALYYAGHIAFRLRNLGSVNRQRLVAGLVSLALIPLAVEVDALVALGMAAALTATVVAYEALHFAEARRRVRSTPH
jgi:low temperature requirement protein LtrA